MNALTAVLAEVAGLTLFAALVWAGFRVVRALRGPRGGTR